mmetsp:Transcript_42567/g.166180  ORF Transcript_42567/g.166180 Transcript_42567/m.166180 type:complete len:398 (+) Transcript_42567:701-1894(+)
MNAILTSLATSDSFRLYVRVVAVTCGGFAAVLNNVLRRMDGDQRGKGLVEPYDLASALRLAGYSSARPTQTRQNSILSSAQSTSQRTCTFVSFTCSYRVDFPRDADETYDKILSLLTDQMKSAAASQRAESLDLRSVRNGHGRSFKSRRYQILPSTGYLGRRLTCGVCGYSEGLKLETFNRLSFAMPPKEFDEVHLTKCLHEVTGKEELIDGIYCWTCESSTPQTLSYKIARLPQMLCVHLKRLNWSAETGAPVRDDRPAVINLKITASQLTSGHGIAEQNGVEYRLRSVVLHSEHTGRSGGHYTCLRYAGRHVEKGIVSLVQDGVDNESGVWYCVNDDSVTQSGLLEGERVKSAYMLFYEAVSETNNGSFVLRETVGFDRHEQSRLGRSAPSYGTG